MDNDTSGWVGGDRLIEHVSDMYFILYGFCQQLFRLYTHLHLMFFLYIMLSWKPYNVRDFCGHIQT